MDKAIVRLIWLKYQFYNVEWCSDHKTGELGCLKEIYYETD